MRKLVLLSAFIFLGYSFSPLLALAGETSDHGCKIIYDFEGVKELQGLNWQCHTWYERSQLHATSGHWSLKVEMYPPETYPGLAISDLKRSWKGTRQVRLDIFNPGSQPLPVVFRIDDRRNDPPYSDRVNHRQLLLPGMNHVCLDFARLRTSGTKRPLKTADICAFMFFTVSPKRPVTIFVDNIRLCK